MKVRSNEFNTNMLPEGLGGILYHSSMFDDKFIYFDFTTVEEEYLINDDLLLRAYTMIKNIPVQFKFSYYENNNPPSGLYNMFNEKYIVNFKKFIEKVKFILY